MGNIIVPPTHAAGSAYKSLGDAMPQYKCHGHVTYTVLAGAQEYSIRNYSHSTPHTLPRFSVRYMLSPSRRQTQHHGDNDVACIGRGGCHCGTTTTYYMHHSNSNSSTMYMYTCTHAHQCLHSHSPVTPHIPTHDLVSIAYRLTLTQVHTPTSHLVFSANWPHV